MEKHAGSVPGPGLASCLSPTQDYLPGERAAHNGLGLPDQLDMAPGQSDPGSFSVVCLLG